MVRALANSEARSSSYMKQAVLMAPLLLGPTNFIFGSDGSDSVANLISIDAWATENSIYSLFNPDMANQIDFAT